MKIRQIRQPYSAMVCRPIWAPSGNARHLTSHEWQTPIHVTWTAYARCCFTSAFKLFQKTFKQKRFSKNRSNTIPPPADHHAADTNSSATLFLNTLKSVWLWKSKEDERLIGKKQECNKRSFEEIPFIYVKPYPILPGDTCYSRGDAPNSWTVYKRTTEGTTQDSCKKNRRRGTAPANR